jgi:acid stress chaperone HdeB
MKSPRYVATISVETNQEAMFMIRLFLAAAALGTITLSLPASAMEMDMATITCKDVMAMDSDSQLGLAIWMSGFAHGKAGNTKIDNGKMHDNAVKVVDVCKKSPDSTIMSAMEQASKM